ncbi:hypothetical protein IWX50DRAFT_614906 [Phyllosticta citricarpa]|uniref:Uncharacterized protein n=1 Tax=Phyllosticta citricarpa TaxID=55181 RepID=A0ABR1L9F3_9PEZI
MAQGQRQWSSTDGDTAGRSDSDIPGSRSSSSSSAAQKGRGAGGADSDQERLASPENANLLLLVQGRKRDGQTRPSQQPVGLLACSLACLRSIFVTAHQGKSDHVIVGDAPNRRANAGKSPPARAHPECRPSSTHGRRGSAGEDGVILGPCTSQEVELVVCAKSTLADGERAIPAVLRANEQEVSHQSEEKQDDTAPDSAVRPGRAGSAEGGGAGKEKSSDGQTGWLSVYPASQGRAWVGWTGPDWSGSSPRAVAIL